MTSNKNERKRRVGVRLTQKEVDYVTKKMKEADHKTFSSFMRDCIVRTEIVHVDHSHYRVYAYALNRIGNNLNQAMAKKHQGKIGEEEFIKEMRIIMKQLEEFLDTHSSNEYELQHKKK